MSATGFRGDGLGRLVDSHRELCELFEGKGRFAGHEEAILVAFSGGKATAECFADLVDRALAAYEGPGLAQDPRILALKIALTDAIVEMA